MRSGRSSTSHRSWRAASPRAFPDCIGEPYEDGSATPYLALIGQPILIYGADRAALTRALERALARDVKPAVYTEEMFKTTHDAANRAVVKAVPRTELNLVGLAFRAERKVIDKVVDRIEVSRLAKIATAALARLAGMGVNCPCRNTACPRSNPCLKSSFTSPPAARWSRRRG